jgi:SRSO17 transposase
MARGDVRAAAKRLSAFHHRFAPLLKLGRDEAQNLAYTYVKGLMVCPERKSVAPTALHVVQGNVSALQKFVNSAPWHHDEVQAEIEAVFADDLAGSAVGILGVVDESAFTKKGNPSAGVDRQHNGHLGKEDN